jgi:hypothetical protein
LIGNPIDELSLRIHFPILTNKPGDDEVIFPEIPHSVLRYASFGSGMSFHLLCGMVSDAEAPEKDLIGSNTHSE